MKPLDRQDKHGHRLFEGACPDCGVVKIAPKSELIRRPRCRRCGCRLQGQRQATHRRGGTKLYWIWAAMIQRCTNPNDRSYKNYGGRGISVCDAWRSFETFAADMGERPDGLSLDRIDVNGNYEPLNCRWAPRHLQSFNKQEEAVGVAFATGGFVAQIVLDGESIYLGKFTDVKEAEACYLGAVRLMIAIEERAANREKRA